jgi:hypothetical protein
VKWGNGHRPWQNPFSNESLEQNSKNRKHVGIDSYISMWHKHVAFSFIAMLLVKE